MDQLQRQVRRAYFRLMVERWLLALTWALTGGLLVAALVILVDKRWPLGVSAYVWLGAGATLGLVTAFCWTLYTRRGALDAAMEIDRRFGLKERVSTALALSAADRETAAGRALMNDAMRRAGAVDIAERFRWSLNRWSLLPLAPATIAMLVALFVPSLAPQQQAAASTTPVAAKKQVQTSIKQLDRKLAERREQAKKEGLKDAEDLFQKLEQATQRDLQKPANMDKKQALTKLNDLSQELEERRNKLAGSESLKQQLNNMKNLDRGPADKFAQALKQGDLKQAIQELEKLKKELAAGKLDEKAREQLTKQLEQMREKLEQMAEAREQAKERLKQRIAEKRAAGKQGEADQLQRELDELNQQQSQQKQMQKLAQKLGQCAQCMKQGDAEGAGKQLSDMQSDLEDLQSEMAEAELLDQAMNEIDQAKDSMNCKKCGGMGCGHCQGKGMRPGEGLGRGRGQGPRPEQQEKTNAYDTAVKQKTGRGAAQIVDFVDGPNIKGGVQQEIATQFEEAKSEAADPLTGQRLPRDSQSHAKEYFDALREGRSE